MAKGGSEFAAHALRGALLRHVTSVQDDGGDLAVLVEKRRERPFAREREAIAPQDFVDHERLGLAGGDEVPPPLLGARDVVAAEKHRHDIAAEHLGGRPAEEVLRRGIHLEDGAARIGLEHRDRRALGKERELAAVCLHLAVRFQQAVELLGELGLHLGVVVGQPPVGAAHAVGAREHAGELVRGGHCGEIEERHHRAEHAEERRAVGEEHHVEGQDDRRGIERVEPPHRGEERQAPGGDERDDERNQHLLVLRAGKEHRRGEAPARAEHRGGERRTADPELRLGALARAAIGERERGEVAGAADREREPKQHELRRPHSQEICGQKQAERERRAGARQRAAIDEVAALAFNVGHWRLRTGRERFLTRIEH